MAKDPKDNKNIDKGRPSKEELQAKADAAAAELEKLKKDAEESEDQDEAEEEEAEDEEQDESEEDSEDEADEEEVDEEAEDESDEEEPADEDEDEAEEEEKKPKTPEEDEEPETPEKKEQDKDKKLRASTQEAQILFERNRQVQEAIKNAASIPEPTEDELKKEYSEWDMMDDTSKKLAKQALTSTRRIEAITSATARFEELDKWQDEVDGFLEDPKTLEANPKLEGREKEFRIFASKPTRRGVTFDVLLGAFFYETDEENKEKKKKHKGAMFEQGNGGPKTKHKKDVGLSTERAANLRKTNFKEFKRQLKAGKIKPSL